MDRCYGQKFLTGLIVGAEDANLRENSPNYYKVGMLLSQQYNIKL